MAFLQEAYDILYLLNIKYDTVILINARLRYVEKYLQEFVFIILHFAFLKYYFTGIWFFLFWFDSQKCGLVIQRRVCSSRLFY